MKAIAVVARGVWLVILLSGCVERGTDRLGEPCSKSLDQNGQLKFDSCEPPLTCSASVNSDGVGKGHCYRPCSAGCSSPCECNGTYCVAPRENPPACAGIVGCAEVPDGCGGTAQCNACKAPGTYCGGAGPGQCGTCSGNCPSSTIETCDRICRESSARCMHTAFDMQRCINRCRNPEWLPLAGPSLDCLLKTCSLCYLDLPDAGP